VGLAGADTLNVAGSAIALLAGTNTITGGAGTDIINVTGVAGSTVNLGASLTGWETIAYSATGGVTITLDANNISSTGAMTITASSASSLSVTASAVTGGGSLL